MSDLIIAEHNCETGEVIKRQMTAAELEQAEKDKAAYQAEIAAAQAKATQRQALLARLGITEEEARILLGGN